MPDDSAPAPARTTTAEGHQPNHLLRARRKATPSPTLASEPMSRAELADAVNHHLWHTTGKVHAMNAHTIARYERGAIRWPTTPYRHALRAVLHAASDTELGFRPHRHTPASPPPSTTTDRNTMNSATPRQPAHQPPETATLDAWAAISTDADTVALIINGTMFPFSATHDIERHQAALRRLINAADRCITMLDTPPDTAEIPSTQTPPPYLSRTART